MQDNAPQSCDYGADVSSTNFCLCSGNSFINGAATEIYISCGRGVLTTSAQTLYTICTEYAPGALQLTMAEIVYAGDGGQSVAGIGTQRRHLPRLRRRLPRLLQLHQQATATLVGVTPIQAVEAGASDLSVGGIIGIVAGICMIIGLPVTIWMCCRRRS